MVPQHPSYVISAIGYIVDEDGNVLLAKHAKRGWELPGGAIEVGEDGVGALVREVEEETGYTVAVTGFIGMYFDFDHETVVLQFRGRPVAATLKQVVGSEGARWFPPEEVKELVTNEPGSSRLCDALASNNPIVCRGFRSNPYQVVRESVWQSSAY